MLYLNRMVEFEASHYYWDARLSPEENLARYGSEAHPHGHNWTAQIGITGEADPRTGMVVNIKELDEIARRCVVQPLDHKCLNLDVPAFKTSLPTPENVAFFIWKRIAPNARGFQLVSAEAAENKRSKARFNGQYEESTQMPIVTLTRAYEFTATHRLHNPNLSDEENLQLYGKCNNLNGHGHDYRLEVSVQAPLDEQAGAARGRGQIDPIVQKEAVKRLDYQHMNDMKEFQNAVPTTENLVRFLYETMQPLFEQEGLQLLRARLYETRKSWFDYGETV